MDEVINARIDAINARINLLESSGKSNEIAEEVFRLAEERESLIKSIKDIAKQRTLAAEDGLWQER